MPIQITGSWNLTGSFTSSLGFQGTSSYATTASYALTGGSGTTFPYTGSAQITGSQAITGSLTVTGNIVNNLGMGFVSCSLSVIAPNTASISFVATFKDVDGSTLARPQQLIHWWTSTAETGSASALRPVTVVSGSNIVPISNSGSINHAVTNNNSVFAIRVSGGTDTPVTVWFNTEVQGIIYSISQSINSLIS